MMTASIAATVLLTVDAAIGLVLVLLFSAIVVKSHCCGRLYNRKQRVFLYLLLASFGTSVTYVVSCLSLTCDIMYVAFGFEQLVDVLFCWAALYICFEVFTTIRRRAINIECLKFRFHTIVEEVCLLTVVIAISGGWITAIYYLPTQGHPDLWCSLFHVDNASFDDTLDNALKDVAVFTPRMFIMFVDMVSVFLVLAQLYRACQGVQSGEVANRLRKPAVEAVTLLFFLVVYGVSYISYEVFRANSAWFDLHFLIIQVTLRDTIIPCTFVTFFGWSMLQDLGHWCWCGRHRSRQGYAQIPVPEEGPAQSHVQSTTRTYHTCDDGGTTTRTYYTCDESQPPEWFKPPEKVSTPN